MIIRTDKGDSVHPHLRAMDVIAKAVGKYTTLLGMSASQRGKGASASSKARDCASSAAIEALGKASESEQDLI